MRSPSCRVRARGAVAWRWACQRWSLAVRRGKAVTVEAAENKIAGSSQVFIVMPSILLRFTKSTGATKLLIQTRNKNLNEAI